MTGKSIMHEVIICEKPSSAEKIAKALSPSAKKKVYNKKVKYWELKRDEKDITVVSGVGHLYSLIPKKQKYRVSFDLHWVPAHEASKASGFTKNYLNAIKKFGKNAVLKGMNLNEGGTTMLRNNQIGGHRAGEETSNVSKKKKQADNSEQEEKR